MTWAMTSPGSISLTLPRSWFLEERGMTSG